MGNKEKRQSEGKSKQNNALRRIQSNEKYKKSKREKDNDDNYDDEKKELYTQNTVAIFINCMFDKRLVIASPSRKH